MIIGQRQTRAKAWSIFFNQLIELSFNKKKIRRKYYQQVGSIASFFEEKLKKLAEDSKKASKKTSKKSSEKPENDEDDENQGNSQNTVQGKTITQLTEEVPQGSSVPGADLDMSLFGGD